MRRLIVALGLVMAALGPPGVSAQARPTSAQQLVKDRRVVYDAAKKQHEADEAELQRIRHEWDQLISRLAAADARGDDDEVQRLRGQLQERTGVKRSAENTWQASLDEWRDAGDGLMSALNAYLEVLDNQIGASQVGTDDTANRLYNEYEEELRELELELAKVEREPPELAIPDVTIRDEDGPRDIRRKLNLVETRVQAFEKVLADLDREIEGLLKRQARERRRNTSGDIFDDNTIPTGVRTNVTDDTQVTDTTAVTFVKPLEERIAEKREFRNDVNEFLSQLKAKAEEIRSGRRGT